MTQPATTFAVALSHHKAGRADEAARLYQSILDAEPDHADTLVNLGALYASQRHYEKAQHYYGRALGLTPDKPDILTNIGNLAMAQGRVEEAEGHYRRALARAPELTPALVNLAITCDSAGRGEEAARLLERALELDPNLVQARLKLAKVLFALDRGTRAREELAAAAALAPGDLVVEREVGTLLLDQGDLGGARRHLDTALAADADDAITLFYAGNLARELGDHAAAVELFERSVAADPTLSEVFNNMSDSLRRLRRAEEAVAAALRAVKLRPSLARAHNTLGNAYLAFGIAERAIAAYEEALRLDPGFAVAMLNLGNTRRDMHQIEAAMACYHAAMEIDPGLGLAHNCTGLTYQLLGRYDEAVAAFQRAIELDPGNVEPYNNLAITWQEMGRYREAVECYRHAIARDGSIPEIHFNLGSLLQTLGRYDESVDFFQEALRLRPEYSTVFSYLAHSLLQQCYWLNLDALISKAVARLEVEHRRGTPLSVSPFALQSLPVPQKLRVAAARDASARYARRVAGLRPVEHHPPRSNRRERLRVGYVSPDFRFHSVAVAFQGVLEHHDHDAFEFFGYSLATGDSGPTGRDDLTTSFQARFDGFRELAGLSFEQAMARIQSDRIDVLIDLAGHTRGTRLELFALRPAPIQAHYLGYSTTVGADYIPYLITDRRMVPPELESTYTERLVFLPDSFLATTRAPVAETTPSRAECGLPEEGFVFANFNSRYKFDPWIFAIWMRLLRRVPDAVLWLMSGSETSRANLRREAATRGVEPGRLVFADKLSHDRHLARHRLVDIALDNRIHGGGVTTVDALWMGVPVVTVASDIPQSRNGASLLHAIAVPELVCDSLDSYERLALNLARDPSALATLKARLAANRESEPLFDSARLARHLERAYRTMWEIHASGSAPRSFEVEPIDGKHGSWSQPTPWVARIK